MPITQLFSIFLLGLIGGSVPGPILASAFTESLKSGFIRSLRVIFKALVGETLVVVLILTVLFSVNIPQIYFYILSLIGACVLIYLALQVWKIKGIGSGKKEIFSFWKIFLLTIFNGSFWIFWITICVPQAFLLKENIAGGQFIFLILFELGWLFSTVILTFIFSRFRQLLTNEKIVHIVFKVLAILLLLFAIQMAYESVKYFIQ
ncbi:MAG: transporter, LysE family [Parcubacteria group bacterium Athens0714_26]|nr:MAG: transporter, LysE family [Parcubacteria group bacterium Athens1014_26]TSD01290.1 MAG: transporter, LysE family [Parcubacteria group bacterium Athens0714_26]